MADRDAPIYDRLSRIPERAVADAAALDALLHEAREPFVIRGLVADWPLVAEARKSARAVRQYLLDRARDRPFTVSIGPPGHDGRFFYDANMEMNFRTGTGKLADIFAGIDKSEELNDPRAVYLGSVDMAGYFDGLLEANRVDFGDRQPLGSILIG
ncbi:MAG: cupin-like domain-containing protein, partial [Sphingopyxis sp.]|nr:cupin-like domain-containing protein [Sphingopyxis sp.]